MFVQRKGNVDLMSCFLCVVLSSCLLLLLFLSGVKKKGEGERGPEQSRVWATLESFKCFIKL